MIPTFFSWQKLPNAEHINAVLAHARTYPHKWTTGYYSEARAAALLATVPYVPGHIRVSAKTEAGRLGTNSSFESVALIHAVEDAFLALASWPDCAYILDLHPDVVRTLAGSGNHAAALLLPGIIAMNGDDNEI